MSKEIKMSDVFAGDLHYEEDPLNKSYRFTVFQDNKAQAATQFEDQADAICLSVNNHDRLVEENKRLREALEVAKVEIKKISNSIDVLDVWIDNESSCAEWVSIDVIKSRLGKMYGRALRLLSELDGNK